MSLAQVGRRAAYLIPGSRGTPMPGTRSGELYLMIPCPRMRQTLPELFALAVVLTVVVVLVLVRRILRAGGDPGPHGEVGVGRQVLVAVAHPASAEGLGDLAASMARTDRGRVEALSVIDEGSATDVRSLAEETVTRCRASVVDAGVEAATHVRVDRSVGQGILHRTVEIDASLVVLGWPGPGQAQISPDLLPAVLDSPAPLVLARLQGYRWQRVRLCVPSEVFDEGHRASVRLATDIWRRIGEANDVPIVRDPSAGMATPEVASELRVVAVAPDRDEVLRAIGGVEPLGDLVVALCHGPCAREHRALLASAERLYEAAITSPSS